MAILARVDLPANNADELAVYAIKAAKEGESMTYASVGSVPKPWPTDATVGKHR
jgi:hypothetical protein